MRKIVHVKHEKSSKKMSTYFYLMIDGCRKGPMMSLWIRYKGKEAF
jgi:hypothetical protein